MCCIVVGWAQAQENIIGRLAYIGSDNNVYTHDFASGQDTPLTTDASKTRRYQWPTWSNDDLLAYFCCDLQAADTAKMQGYISATGREAGRVVYEGTAAPVIYASWAPAPCDAAGTCRDLALLINDVPVSGLRVDLVRDTGTSQISETIARGSPFYYTWSPDATKMVFHRYGSELSLYDLASKDISGKTDAPVTFQTPAWSPIDDRILSLVPGSEANRSTLMVSTSDVQQTPLRENLSGLLSFLWSPDGRYVAFRQFGADGEYGAVFIVDAVTGEIVARSDVKGVIAFFWSPDSTQLAYITVNLGSGMQASLTSDMLVAYQGSAQLEWSVLAVVSGFNRPLYTFTPTTETIYLLLYFDQFAPSHRVWSPDSRYLVFGEVGSSNPLISIYDVQQNQQTTVAEGIFAVWSWR